MSLSLQILSDSQLLARVQATQDPLAFRQLVLRYQSPLRRWARRLCNDDAAAGDDLAQETFLQAYRALHTFRQDARFSTWLYRIAFNLAASRRRILREQWQSVEWDDNDDSMASSSDAQLSAALTLDLDSALALLPAPQQLVLRLSLDGGMSQQEVADILSLPLGTVKSHMQRGKAALRKQLAPWQEDRS